MRLAVLVAAVSWIGGAVPAEAGEMDQLDLASLVHVSAHVVYADEVAHTVPPGKEWEATTTYRVTRALRGGLAGGTTIEVADDSYRLDPMMGPAIQREPKTLLFLGAATDGKYHRVASGMRLFAHGKVYRFSQRMNPGPYEPVVQGTDPDDAWGRDPTGVLAPSVAVDVATFEHALARALDRAHVVEQALALADRPARLRSLLALLPPPLTLPAQVTLYNHEGTDALDRAILEAVWTSGDEAAIRESLGRDVPVSGITWRYERAANGDVSAVKLLTAIALDPAAPAHQRIGAIRGLADSGTIERKDLAALLEPLVHATDANVRATAIWEIGAKLRAQVTPVLLAAARREHDAVVRVALGKVLELPDMHGDRFAALGKDERAVAAIVPLETSAAITPGAVTVGFEWVARPGVTVGVLELHLVRGATERVVGQEEVIYGSPGSRISRFGFASPALAAGTYQAWLDVPLAEGGKRTSILTQTIAITVK